MEVRAGGFNIYRAPDTYSELAESLVMGTEITPDLHYNVWPYLSFRLEREIGFSFSGITDIGIGFPTSDKNIFLGDFSIGLGNRFYISRLCLDIYTLAGIMFFNYSNTYMNSDAVALGLTIGSDDIELHMLWNGFFVKPGIALNYFLLPGVMVSLKGEYRLFFYDTLNITLTEVSAEEPYQNNDIKNVRGNKRIVSKPANQQLTILYIYLKTLLQKGIIYKIEYL